MPEVKEFPTVSVLMPVHNGAEFLAEAIDSILSQTFADFEFIIIDDGSTDESGEIIARYAKQDMRIRPLSNEENIGIPQTLNRGIAESKGRFVARTDADDISLSNRLEKQISRFAADPDLMLCGTYCAYIDAEGRKLRVVSDGARTWEVEWISLFRNPITHPTAMYRRDVLARHSLIYDESFRFAQDYDLWGRILDHGKAVVIDEILVLYRTHPRAISEREGFLQRRFCARVATGLIRRRYPHIDNDTGDVSMMIGLLYGTVSADQIRVYRAIRIIDRLKTAFCTGNGLSVKNRIRVNQLMARWLAVCFKRNRGVWRSSQAFWFCLHTLKYLPYYFLEFAGFLKRRLLARSAGISASNKEC